MKIRLALVGLVSCLALVGFGCTKNDDQGLRVEINGLSFAVPTGWSIQSVDEEVATFGVPDSQYEVSIPVRVRSEVSVSPAADGYQLLNKTESGAEIYDGFCAPSLGCYYLDFDGEVYLVSFGTPQSDEPAPEELDGPWFPRTEVTTDELLEVVMTAAK